MMALFRIVEPTSGALLIDGIDTSTLGLTQLRSRLSLVPQDPVIFSGSIRSNLDPFGQAGSDGELWGALGRAGLDGLVRGLGVSVEGGGVWVGWV
jgi:ABC-type multidrug transport system fused ATPase/permease subunit